VVGLPPHLHRILEVPHPAQVLEGQDQPVDVARRVATLQESLPRARNVRWVLFQRAPRIEVAQRHLQCLTGLGQRRRIAGGDVTLQREGGVLLAARPVALADDPRGGRRLQLLHQGREPHQSNRHAGEQYEAQGQAPRYMRYGRAAHVTAASQHQIPPAPW